MPCGTKTTGEKQLMRGALLKRYLYSKSTRDSTRDSTRNSTRDSTCDSTRDSPRDNTRNSTRNSTRRVFHEKHECEWWMYGNGKDWSTFVEPHQTPQGATLRRAFPSA
jgi:hypothetical protein